MKSLRKYRAIVLFITDILVICLAYMLTAFLLENTEYLLSPEHSTIITNSIITSVLVYEVILNIFGVYRSITRYENGKDYIQYIVLSGLSGLIIFFMTYMFKLSMVNFKQIILANILIAVGMVTYRVLIRFILTTPIEKKEDDADRKNLLIIGAGEASREIIKALKTSSIRGKYNIVGLIDDNQNKIGYKISGITIIGNRYAIEEVCKNAKVEIPSGMIETQIDNMEKDISSRLSYQGMNLDQYLQMIGKTKKEFRDEYKEEAEKQVKVNLVLEAIMKDSKIEVTEEEIDAKIKEMAETYGQKEEEAKNNPNLRKYVEETLKSEKTIHFIVDNAKIK